MRSLLIVDDNTMNLDILKNLFKDEYKLSFAKNGKVALKILEKKIPDLILLDVMMPVMGGYETYKEIVMDNRFKDTHIIFLSAVDEIDQGVQQLDESRLVSLIKKPFDVAEIKNIVSEVLNERVI